MKTLQSFRIYFTLKTEKAKEGRAPLYAAVTVNKEKCFLALKQTVSLTVWDKAKDGKEPIYACITVDR